MLEIISEKIVFNIFFLISRLLLDYSFIGKENSISNCNEFFETNKFFATSKN